MKSIKHFINIKNKKYPYSLKVVDKNKTILGCPAANINQEFLNDDIPALLIDLPNLILSEQQYNHKQTEVIRFRISGDDKKAIENPPAWLQFHFRFSARSGPQVTKNF